MSNIGQLETQFSDVGQTATSLCVRCYFLEGFMMLLSLVLVHVHQDLQFPLAHKHNVVQVVLVQVPVSDSVTVPCRV